VEVKGTGKNTMRNKTDCITAKNAGLDPYNSSLMLITNMKRSHQHKAATTRGKVPRRIWLI